MSKFIELIIIVVVTIIIVCISVHLIQSQIMQFLHNKENEQIIQETKIKQTLQGMNYNNSEGWYKNCKVKIIHDKFNDIEKDLNEFINDKDIVDIKMSNNRILIIYIEKINEEVNLNVETIKESNMEITR